MKYQVLILLFIFTSIGLIADWFLKERWISGRIGTPETMKLFCSAKKLTDTTRNGENVPSLELVELVLVQCNLVDNQ